MKKQQIVKLLAITGLALMIASVLFSLWIFVNEFSRSMLAGVVGAMLGGFIGWGLAELGKRIHKGGGYDEH